MPSRSKPFCVLRFAFCVSKAHLLAALAGSLVSLLFALQHGIIAVILLVHRPANQASAQPSDVMLGWVGTLLPLALRATAEGTGPLSLAIVVIGSLLASGRFSRWGAASGWSRRIVDCRLVSCTGSCGTRSTPLT